MGLYPRNGPGERVSFPCFRFFFRRRTNDLMVMMTVARDGRRRAEQEDDEDATDAQHAKEVPGSKR